MTPEKLKAQFRARGETFSQWARDRGYSPIKVIRLINGYEKGAWGQAHEIAVALGLKEATESSADQQSRAA